jgi:hypothetical protein
VSGAVAGVVRAVVGQRRSVATVIAAESCDGVASCGGNRGDAAALLGQIACRDVRAVPQRSALAAVLATA